VALHGSFRHRLVTVFGGTGFIGRHLIRRLAGGGARIQVISRNPARGRHLQPMGNVGQIVTRRADTTSEEALAAVIGGSWAVVNLVAILYETRRHTFQSVHVDFADRIARAAKAAGAERLLHISAIGADPDSPAAYARTKAAGEAAVREAFPEATIFRPSVVVGPEDGYFNRFGEMARFLPALPLIGGGKTRFQLVWVGDVADAMIAALERQDARGKTYELGGPRIYTFEETMRWMLKEIGRRRFLVPISFSLASLMARVLELLPVPPLTRDQVELLKVDNVVTEGALTLGDLGVRPTPIELVVPDYLMRYRPYPSRIARS
jgi:uncharacterized protein YbjT (DUF2867 family)